MIRGATHPFSRGNVLCAAGGADKKQVLGFIRDGSWAIFAEHLE
jgi:hypothetical protein